MKKNKTKEVRSRLTAEDKENFIEYAKRKGITVSDLIRVTVNEKIKEHDKN